MGLPTGDVPAPGGAARGQDHPPVPYAGGGWLCFRSAGEDFDEISVTEQVQQTAEFAVRISGDAMAPYLEDGAVAYVSRTPLREGDVGIFSVNGKVLCRQYDRDDSGTVYLFSLNRRRADGDVTLPAAEAGTLICFGRVLTGTLSNRN